MTKSNALYFLANSALYELQSRENHVHETDVITLKNAFEGTYSSTASHPDLLRTFVNTYNHLYAMENCSGTELETDLLKKFKMQVLAKSKNWSDGSRQILFGMN